MEIFGIDDSYAYGIGLHSSKTWYFLFLVSLVFLSLQFMRIVDNFMFLEATAKTMDQQREGKTYQ